MCCCDRCSTMTCQSAGEVDAAVAFFLHFVICAAAAVDFPLVSAIVHTHQNSRFKSLWSREEEVQYQLERSTSGCQQVCPTHHPFSRVINAEVTN
jgi:hypothetical protein